jgi:hypothetical protein
MTVTITPKITARLVAAVLALAVMVHATTAEAKTRPATHTPVALVFSLDCEPTA